MAIKCANECLQSGTAVVKAEAIQAISRREIPHIPLVYLDTCTSVSLTLDDSESNASLHAIYAHVSRLYLQSGKNIAKEKQTLAFHNLVLRSCLGFRLNQTYISQLFQSANAGRMLRVHVKRIRV
jgi:hypothetical protein